MHAMQPLPCLLQPMGPSSSPAAAPFAPPLPQPHSTTTHLTAQHRLTPQPHGTVPHVGALPRQKPRQPKTITHMPANRVSYTSSCPETDIARRVSYSSTCTSWPYSELRACNHHATDPYSTFTCTRVSPPVLIKATMHEEDRCLRIVYKLRTATVRKGVLPYARCRPKPAWSGPYRERAQHTSRHLNLPAAHGNPHQQPYPPSTPFHYRHAANLQPRLPTPSTSAIAAPRLPPYGTIAMRPHHRHGSTVPREVSLAPRPEPRKVSHDGAQPEGLPGAAARATPMSLW